MPSRPSRFAPYRAALEAISTRTKTPLPSLIASFAILHELTAIVPLVSIFFTAHGLGIGEQAVAFVRKPLADDQGAKHSWMREVSTQWLSEGEEWAAGVGRRYGVFGYPKGSEKEVNPATPSGNSIPQNLPSDVANAVFAYGVTKVR